MRVSYYLIRCVGFVIMMVNVAEEDGRCGIESYFYYSAMSISLYCFRLLYRTRDYMIRIKIGVEELVSDHV